MNRHKPIILALAGLLAVTTPALADMSLDVSPIRVQARLEAGEEYTNAIRVLNSGKEPIRLRAYVEDWYLDDVGTPIFRPAGTLEKTSSIWIDAAPRDFLIEPGQTKFVRYTVTVPPDIADGGYHGALLLESLPLDRSQKNAMQMFVQGRVACMMYVSVGNPRKSARITSLAAVRKGDQNLLRVQVENDGEDFIRLDGGMELLSGGEVVGDTVELPDVPVLPGTRRVVDLQLGADQVHSHVLARVTIDLDGVGLLRGEYPLDPDKVQRVQ